MSANILNSLVTILLLLTTTIIIKAEIFQNTVGQNSKPIPSAELDNSNSKFPWDKSDPAAAEHDPHPYRPAEPLTPSEFDDSNLLTPAEFEPPKIFWLSSQENPDNVKKYGMKNGLVDKERRWPMAVVPYVISDQFDQKWRLLIARSFKEFHRYTCVRFVPRKNQKDYIYIISGTGCDSDAGREGGEQTVSLGPDCHYLSTVVHELNHAVGFWHEQNRYDRDSYIKIHWDNIIPENRFNFDKLKQSEITDFGVPYDTNSIMHYDQFAFSKDPDKLPVMTPYEPNPNMGLATRFSKSDIEKINRMYDCNFLKPWLGKPTTISARSGDNGVSPCIDFHSNCTELAKTINGPSLGCDSTWTKVNCQKSCNRCDHCEDVQDKCVEWAKDGHCQSDSEYMYLYCPKSCEMCSRPV